MNKEEVTSVEAPAEEEKKGGEEEEEKTAQEPVVTKS